MCSTARCCTGRGGAPGVVLFALAESAGGDGIVAQPGLDSLADLSGRVVGLHKSSTSYFFFLTALERAGVDEENLRVREMLSEDMTRAFLAGELDAAVTWQPWLERMARRPGAHVLVSSRDFPRTIVDVLVMRKQMADDAPQVCMGLARAWFDAVDWMQSHPVEANAIIGDALGIAPNRVADMLAGVRFLGREENREFLARSRPGNIFEVADRAGRFWTQRGFIDSHANRGFIAPEYVSGALRGPDRVGR
ncbi:ABC transporter substrate-binding protein [Pseudodesulfovibrio tunisiensis]|uniref:ABC transporter substrate-binding protein n=1 Tax=Pseudodesulfovibrio tunisiensis TaxID=463192 RepID=UPI001FB32B5F|nr:ABC transporter substrate-binding protein [Pseudodesulfovibrio tunisiensis]